MIFNRFGWFLSNIQCNDSSLEPIRGSNNFNKLYKLRPVIEKLGVCFKKSKNHIQELTIDGVYGKIERPFNPKAIYATKTNQKRLQDLDVEW